MATDSETTDPKPTDPKPDDALDLGRITEIFLIPVAILVGALCVADNEPLKIAISALGALSSLLWSVCSFSAAIGYQSARAKILKWMPVACILPWLFAVGVHVNEWRNLPNANKPADCGVAQVSKVDQ